MMIHRYVIPERKKFTVYNVLVGNIGQHLQHMAARGGILFLTKVIMLCQSNKVFINYKLSNLHSSN